MCQTAPCVPGAVSTAGLACRRSKLPGTGKSRGAFRENSKPVALQRYASSIRELAISGGRTQTVRLQLEAARQVIGEKREHPRSEAEKSWKPKAPGVRPGDLFGRAALCASLGPLPGMVACLL